MPLFPETMRVTPVMVAHMMTLFIGRCCGESLTNIETFSIFFVDVPGRPSYILTICIGTLCESGCRGENELDVKPFRGFYLRAPIFEYVGMSGCAQVREPLF